MLTKWHVTNFKSFRDHEPIALSKINIIAGANSSGKSTIIQSILLLKQTLQYGSDERPLVLNGPIMRLGAFSDVHNQQSDDSSIKFSAELTLQDVKASDFGATTWARMVRQGSANEIERIRLDLTYDTEEDSQGKLFSGPEVQANLSPVLMSTSIRAERGASSSPVPPATIQFRRRLDGSGDEEAHPFDEYRLTLNDPDIADILARFAEVEVLGGWTAHFLPSNVWLRYNSTAQSARSLVQFLTGPNSLLGSRYRRSDEPVPSAAIDALNAWLDEHQLEKLGQGLGSVTAEAVQRHLRRVLFSRNPSRALGQTSSEERFEVRLSSLRERLTDALAEQEIEYAYDSVDISSASPAVQFLRGYFRDGIRYLGPLRDAPKPVYQPEPLESSTSVGYRGEHTAAILDLNRWARVEFHKPPNLSKPVQGKSAFEANSSSLQMAVVEWLRYLDVAAEVSTTDAGVYGSRLQVATGVDGNLHDLTNVGVGVSQVLPIVVMALLAPRGSLLIFEQPELHLHPKVQARLADFFISLSLDGKQILLETHSEYLVDRFRLRIAQADDGRMSEDVRILFSERTASGTQLTGVRINEFGAITNWPKDFFEQSQRDAGEILRAASAKRARERGV